MRHQLRMLGWIVIAFTSAACADEPQAIGTFDAVIAEIDEIDVPAQERGLIVEFPIHPGVSIQVGELIGRIDDEAARIHRDLAEDELEIAIHKLQNDLAVQMSDKAIGVAEAELQRAENANQKYEDTVSDSEIARLTFVRDRAVLEKQQAEHSLAELELTVQQKEHELALAELALRRRMIRTQVGGKVVEVLRSAGEWVEPGDPVARIMDTDRVQAEALVTLSEVPVDVTGHPVQVRLTLPNQSTREFNGFVVFVDPTVNVVNGEFRIRAEIENPDQLLRPGHHVSMTVLESSPAASDSGASPDR